MVSSKLLKTTSDYVTKQVKDKKNISVINVSTGEDTIMVGLFMQNEDLQEVVIKYKYYNKEVKYSRRK